MKFILGLVLLVLGIASSLLPALAVMGSIGKDVQWDVMIPYVGWLLLSIIIALAGLTMMRRKPKPEAAD